MFRTPSHRNERLAFTLVELMVVMLILGILGSLISSVVVMATGKLTESETRKEISEMEVALRAFMSDYGLTEPPPSYLFLNETAPLDTTAYDKGLSGAFLEKLFGKSLGPTDFNGDGNTNGKYLLKGERCLIFYLGGIPNSTAVIGGAAPAPQGFAANNINPGRSPALSPKRKGPYFNFVTSRLWPQPQQVPYGWDGFFYYLDPWMTKSGPSYLTVGGSPYAFFSCAGIDGKYAITTDVGAYPYKTADGRYMNPNTYQIISAGRDGTFGNSLWDPSSGATGYAADDQTNFSSTLLGAGQH